MEFLVYPAGPIRNCSYATATDWRALVAQRLAPFDIRVISPLRCKPFLEGIERLSGQGSDHPLATSKGIMVRDFYDVERCDLLLVNLIGATEVSIGTVLEIGAGHILRKPIVLAMEEGNVHEHRVLRAVSGFIVPSLEEAIEITKAVL